jgi:ABC-type thiamine transport system substrate-binding protein
LRKVARANSESVEELAEEGQSFEADVVVGVEEAEDAEESEVVTHEVPEDDVPSEYDDNEH